MEQELSAQIMQWHEDDEHQQIVDTLMKIPPADRDYDMISSMGRAYNNLSLYEKALEQFAFIAEQGKNDPLWYFRVGYSYYYMKRYEEAAAVLSTALELDPGDQHSARLLDWSHSKWQKQQKAESRCTLSKAEAAQALTVAGETKDVAPFILVEQNNDGKSVILTVGSYLTELFDTRSDEGFEGNGYDWASLAAVFLNERMPELADTIHFDPEADMFCAYSSNGAAVEQFAWAFKSACEDEVLIHDLFTRAELD